MLRAEQLYGLLHQLAVRLDLLGFRFELSRFVGEDVQIGPVGQLPLAIMTSRENRRIDERFIVRLFIHIIAAALRRGQACDGGPTFRIGRSEGHTSELQSLMRISYAVFCLKKKKTKIKIQEILMTIESIKHTTEEHSTA